jgi:hypothetical protein
MNYTIEDRDTVFTYVQIFDFDPEEPNQELIETLISADVDLANGMVVIEADERGVFRLSSLWRDGVEVKPLTPMLRDEAQRIANGLVSDLRRDEPALFDCP